jgi:hypothetical protein
VRIGGFIAEPIMNTESNNGFNRLLIGKRDSLRPQGLGYRGQGFFRPGISPGFLEPGIQAQDLGRQPAGTAFAPPIQAEGMTQLPGQPEVGIKVRSSASAIILACRVSVVGVIHSGIFEKKRTWFFSISLVFGPGQCF